MAMIPRDCEVEFVGEGASNLVFKLTPPDDSSSHALLEGKLLRVPKAGTRAYPHEELQEYWESAIRPLFKKDDLIQQSLVGLAGSGIVPKLNAVLAENESIRREDFRGGRVADAELGMLVEDMRETHPGDFVCEFKPKWLAQSPSAPPSSRRCRTCAYRAYRNNKNKGNTHGTSKPALCPLDLPHCGEDPLALRQVLDFITAATGGGKQRGDGDQALAQQLDRLADWLRTNTVMKRLREAQVRHDPRGHDLAKHVTEGDEGEDTEDSGLGLAMTLRDCTCFVRIRVEEESGRPVVEAKLGDLDKKNWGAKIEYWRSVERRLIEEGYYDGKEEPAQRTACRLERKRE